MQGNLLFGKGEVRHFDEGIVLLPHFVDTYDFFPAITAITQVAPFRHLTTPGGKKIGAAMTFCGAWGADNGYHYSQRDKETGNVWPAMPELWRDKATEAALLAGFPGFIPDTCQLTEYPVGTKMGLHQDKDGQKAMAFPVVSFSLGLSARFMIGGNNRQDPVKTFLLHEGDAFIFGGKNRLVFHGVKPIEAGHHPIYLAKRISLVFRKIGE